MGGDTPDPPAAVNSLHETVAALQAMRKLRTCRRALGELRVKFGACDTIKKADDAPAESPKGASNTPKLASSAFPTP